MNSCPNCSMVGHLYYARTWCAACGWHQRGTTLQHANFAPDAECQWCNPAAVKAADLVGILESDGRSVQQIMDDIRGER